MPQIEFTGTHYCGGAYRFTEPGIYEVDEAKATQLLVDFPDRFRVVEISQNGSQQPSDTPNLSKANRAQLEAVAAQIGLEATDQMDTNKKLKEAIEVHQETATSAE